MSWTAPTLTTRLNLNQLKAALADSLAELFRVARFYEVESLVPYGPLVRPSGNTSRVQRINITDGEPFTVANPDQPREGARIVLDFFNDFGGTVGTVTWGSEYVLDGAWEPPEAGQHAVYAFVRGNT
jgi:hypothetical protein